MNKRRRPPREGGINGVSQQNRISSSSSLSKQSRFRHDDGRAVQEEKDLDDINGHCKENIPNGRPSFFTRTPSSVGIMKDGNETACDGRIDIAYTLQSTLPFSVLEEQEGKSSLPTTSVLGFIDRMQDKSALLPAMTTALLGVYSNIMMNDSPSTFQRYLEQAFEYKKSQVDRGINRSSCHQDNSSIHSNAVYHTMLGRINPPSVGDSSAANQHYLHDGTDNQLSIAFPRCQISTQREPRQRVKDSRLVSTQYLNRHRKTGHGLCLPYSWYCFPTCFQTQPSPPSETVSANHIDSNEYTVMNKNEQGCVPVPAVNKDEVETKQPPNCNDDRLLDEIDKKQQPILPRRGVISSPTPKTSTKYQGVIRIESDRGATIREVFDIEKSNVVLGKLNMGDERYYLEKKILPPPPISLLAESDDEYESDDDECVAVVRYKICLNVDDLASQRQLEQSGSNRGSSENDSSELVGWISDRGRLANDPYLILREL